jgi:asparagine N-glycosylation enzyme membrane subunit Stt3
MIYEDFFMMQILYFFIVAIALYWLSDKIINLAEQKRGERFEHRTIYFFFVLLVLSLATFWVIRHLGLS